MKLDLSFGTVVTEQDLYDLLQVLKKNEAAMVQGKYKVFSPIYNPGVMQAIQEDTFAAKYLDYVPGIFCRDDFDAYLIDHAKTFDGAVPKAVKFFPVSVADAPAMLNAIQSHFKEARHSLNASRMIALKPELSAKYGIDSGKLDTEKFKLIKSPRDYYYARNSFLINFQSKIFIDEPKSAGDYGFELIKAIRVEHPEMQLIATGVGKLDTDKLKVCAEAGANIVAKRVFTKTINKLLAGSLPAAEFNQSVKEELNVNIC